MTKKVKIILNFYNLKWIITDSLNSIGKSPQD